MSTSEDREAPMVAATVAALLDQHPAAALCAIGPDGMSMGMPESVPTRGHHLVAARSPLDLVAPADRLPVIDAWKQVQETGSHAHVTVRLHDQPDRSVELHLLDARQSHGVFLGVLVPTDSESDDVCMASLSREVSPLPPRTARARQNEVGEFVEVDEALTRILGWSEEELVGHLSLEFIHPDDHLLAIDNWMQMLASRAPSSRVKLRHHHRDGSWVWIEINNQNLLGDPEHGCVIAEMVNISDEMAANEAVRAREQLLDRLAEALPVGVIQVDADGSVAYTNSRLHAILGSPRAATISEQIATVQPTDRTSLTDAFNAVLQRRFDSDIEVSLVTPPDGDHTESRRCLFSIRALTADTSEVTGAIVCVADVTESARLRDELHLRATFDDITGCRNRVTTLALLEGLLSDADLVGRPAVCFIDLDRFKDVNDKLGHAYGDALLGVVARRLQRAVRAGAIVGRIGGDEFLVISPGVTSPEEAMVTAMRLAQTFRHQVRLKSKRVSCHASVGVAWSSDRCLEAESLVAMADSAMYEAKRNGDGVPVLRRTA